MQRENQNLGLITSPEVAAYLAQIPPAAKAHFEQLRKIVQQAAASGDDHQPTVEKISYGIIGYAPAGRSKCLAFIGAAKEHVACYPIPADPELQQQLTPYLHGKGTARFPLSEPLPEQLIATQIKALLSVDPLLDKLRLSPQQQVGIIGRPDPTVLPDFPDLVLAEAPAESLTAIVCFVTTLAELVAQVTAFVHCVKLVPGGRILLAYPKKGNSRYDTYVGRDDVFPSLGIDDTVDQILGSKFAFNQMVAFDDTFTVIGLKDVSGTPRRQRPKETNPAPELVAQLEAELRPYAAAANFYATLTPGYRRQWAQWVYGAKKEETKQKRFAQAVDLLTAGVKQR